MLAPLLARLSRRTLVAGASLGTLVGATLLLGGLLWLAVGAWLLPGFLLMAGGALAVVLARRGG